MVVNVAVNELISKRIGTLHNGALKEGYVSRRKKEQIGSKRKKR